MKCYQNIDVYLRLSFIDVIFLDGDIFSQWKKLVQKGFEKNKPFPSFFIYKIFIYILFKSVNSKVVNTFFSNEIKFFYLSIKKESSFENMLHSVAQFEK